MSDEAMIDRAAKALQREVASFRMPVDYYISPEAAHRWEVAQTRTYASAVDDMPDTDWSLESYKILALAVLAVVPVPTDNLGAEAKEMDMPPPADPIWSDIALEVLRRLRRAGYEVVPRAPANEASAEAIRHLYAAMAGA